jgi:DNA-binding MurR/RpiR family transcriptional regulator
VLPRIRSLLPTLKPSEARVARVILDEPAAVLRMTVTDLAAAAKAAASTVVRCSQELGFQGFHDLKITLAAEVGAADRLISGELHRGDSAAAVLAKVLASDIEALRDVPATVDDAALEAAVDAINKANSTLLLGVGSSQPVAQDAAYRLLSLGLPVEAPVDTHAQHLSAQLRQKGDVCFAVSHTGSTRETVMAVQAAARAGAVTVALTSYARSPLTELVDHLIVAGSRETAYRMEAMASRIAHLSVIDAIATTLAMRRPRRTRAAGEALHQIASAHRY